MVKKKTKTKKTNILKNRTIISKEIEGENTTTKSKGKSPLIKKGCVDNKVLGNKYKIKERIGTASISGEVNKGCYPLKCKYPIAIKKIPMTYELKYIDKSEDPYILDKYEVYSELFFLKLSSFLVKNDVIPNLPLIYDKYVCEDNCNFVNLNLKDKKQCLLIVNELADGDLKYIFKKVKPDIRTLKIMYFQIYIALYCMRKYFNIYHNDLHYGNVLFRKIKQGGYIKYIVQGQSIVVPNIGYIMILWDFGRSFIPGKIEPYRNTEGNEEEFMDFIRITNMMGGNPGKNEKNYDRLEEILLELINRSKTYNDFVLLYSYIVHNHDIKESDIIAVYNTDKKLTSKDPNINKYIVKKTSNKTSKIGIVNYIKNLFYKDNKSTKKSTLVNSKT